MTGNKADLAAAIDCGTNSTRLLIARPGGAELARETRITRLGQGVDRSSLLAPEAIQRTLDVLLHYRRLIEYTGASRVRIAATSAVRDAMNGREFLERAADVMGIGAELLSGEEEGRLAYAGATLGLEPTKQDDVVIDIGGGSTELILQREGSLSVVSLDVGSVRLTERCLLHDPPTAGEVEAATATVDRYVGEALNVIPALRQLKPNSRLIGLAGTITTLAVLILGLPAYDRQRIHRSRISYPAITNWCTKLLGEAASARAMRTGILPGREDIIAAGVLILCRVMLRLGIHDCVVSETDILDGMVASLTGEEPTALDH